MKTNRRSLLVGGVAALFGVKLAKSAPSDPAPLAWTDLPVGSFVAVTDVTSRPEQLSPASFVMEPRHQSAKEYYFVCTASYATYSMHPTVEYKTTPAVYRYEGRLMSETWTPAHGYILLS